MNERVLVAEDEPILRANLCEYLERAGYEVTGASDGAEALGYVLSEDYAVVISDIRMPNMDGIELLKRIVAERSETLVLLVTAFASVDTAIEALRFGAYDYMLKPVDFDDLAQKVSRLVEHRNLQAEVRRLRRDLGARLGFEGIVGQSAKMNEVYELIEKVAPTRSTVLITGESGTGKELVARAIWARSTLADREFMAVNMAALPPDMVESLLFGHEKGAFTGADRSREGILRAVRGGTVFLDEVAELPMAAQAKLLRALDNGEVLPVGAARPLQVEFRMVVATNQDLSVAINAARFRSDLFYRLNVFSVTLPPLRDRREDIPALVEHFAVRHAKSMGHRRQDVANEVMRILLGYAWPGNVRELSNVIERAVILAGDDRLEPHHLPAELRTDQAAPVELRPAVAEFEERHIQWVIEAAGGNRERAARLLGIDPATLYRKLAKRPREQD